MNNHLSADEIKQLQKLLREAALMNIDQGVRYVVYAEPNRVLTRVGMLPVDMVGPGHRIGAKTFLTEGGARKAAARFKDVLKTRVERLEVK